MGLTENVKTGYRKTFWGALEEMQGTILDTLYFMLHVL